MANLYKCDVCKEVEEGNTRLVVQVTPIGKTWKDRRNFDLCPACSAREEVKAFLKYIKIVEGPASS